MLRVRNIDSIDLPELEPYRTLRQSFEHFLERKFVAEGEKVVRRLLESDLHVLSALMPEDHFLELRPVLEARPEVIEVFIADKAQLEKLIGFTMYQGLLACARIPTPTALDVVVRRARRPRFLVALDELANAENIGAIIRTAVGFGADALIVGETSAHPYLRRAVRSSMGTVFDLPIVETVSLVAALRELRRQGIRCIAAHPRGDERVLPDAALGVDCCVVLGSEGDGLSEAVLKECDEWVAVPMQSGVDSLNVGAAAAVFFYEVWRQRRAPTTSSSTSPVPP